MIRFVYNLDYDPEIVLGSGGQSIAVEGVEKIDTGHEIDRTSVDEETALPLRPETEDTTANDLPGRPPGDDQTDEVDNRVMDELKLHCQVYALAEKYAIKALKILARQKFQKALENIDVDTRLFEVVEEIYSSTPDSDRGLRDIVVSKIYSEIQHWLRQTEFRQALTETSSFCVDLLRETVFEDQKRYEQAIADVQHPGYCTACTATLVTRRTVSRRKNVHLEKYCARCEPFGVS
jgi:hypothetical protein